MSYKKTKNTYKSSDNIHDIVYYVYTPEDGIAPIAVVQLAHGMCEYVERYEDLAEYLTSHGIIFCGADHLGHGSTALSNDEFGFFGKENGLDYVVSDIDLLRALMRKRYRMLPYILLGQSMGSFIARSYIVNYRDAIDGVILAGTSGGDKNINFGIMISGLISKLRGEKYRSKLLYSMSIGNYNKKFKNEKDSSAWLSSNMESRNKYKNDERCNFIFTAKGYNDMFRLLKYVTGPAWAANVPKNLPVFIISGSDDPVGNFGAGIADIESWLTEEELNELKVKLYPGYRHELLQETNCGEVYNDIYEWIESVREGVIAARTQSIFHM